MAYGVKYRMNFGDVLDVSYEIDIYLDGWAGGITAISGDSSFPIQIDMPGEDDPYNPLCISSATIGILDTAGDTYSEFFSADVYEYYCDIKRGGTTWWKGFLITEEYQEQYTTEPYSITLTFGDALNELAFERYDNSGTLRSSMETCINIIVNCQNELPSDLRRPIREMVNVFEDTMNDADTEGLLEQLYIYEPSFWEQDSSDDVIKGQECLSVIRHILLGLGCRMIVSQDILYVQHISEMKTAGAIKYVDYDNTGTVTANSTLDLRQPISARGAALPTLLRPIDGDAERTFNREFQEIEFSYTSKNILTIDNNLIANFNFAKGLHVTNGTVVPNLWTRSTAINTQLGVNGNGMYIQPSTQLQAIFSSPGVISGYEPQGFTLVYEDSMLEKTVILDNPVVDANNQLSGVASGVAAQVTREGYNLISQSPADSTVTFKNLLHSTSDHIKIRVRGYFDYTYTAGIPLTYHAWLFFKWTIKLGANYYNIGNETWDTSVNNRVWSRQYGNYSADPLIDAGTRRHHFDFEIETGDFITTATSDLTITWFTPENNRGPAVQGTLFAIDSVKCVVEEMSASYVSNDSTEFSIQKILGATGSTDLRTRRKKVEMKHGDGPSNFSVNSFRRPTSNLATTTWSSRGGAEALPGYKQLIFVPYFELFGVYRQQWSGSLYGFLEPHNTVSNIEGKIFIIKSYSFNIRAATHTVTLHEVGASVPSIIYVTQINLSGYTPVITGNNDIGTTEQAVEDVKTTTQGLGTVNLEAVSVANTQVVKNNNDSTETGKDYPL